MAELSTLACDSDSEDDTVSKSWNVISSVGDGVVNQGISFSQQVISKGSALATRIVSAVGDAMQKTVTAVSGTYYNNNYSYLQESS